MNIYLIPKIYFNCRLYYLGFYGQWWSSTKADADGSLFRRLSDFENLERDSEYKNHGMSIRCLRD